MFGTGALFAQAPPAPSHPVVERIHGVMVVDPYRNLENLTSAETKAWLGAQGDFAAAQLARIEGRAALAERIEALARASGDAVRQVTRMPGGRVYYLKRRVGENQFKLVMRQGASGAERVLVDPERETRATGTPHAVNYFVPSWDGKTLAYGMSAGGSEDTSLYLLDMETGAPVGAPIPRVRDEPRPLDARQPLAHLQPGARAARRRAGDGNLSRHDGLAVRSRRRDAPPSRCSGRSSTHSGSNASTSRKSSLPPTALDGRAHHRYHACPKGASSSPAVAALGDAKIVWRPIATVADKITDVALRGDTLYCRAGRRAARARVRPAAAPTRF